jgi:sodium/potassium-transporting ATPase subunit alpha
MNEYANVGTRAAWLRTEYPDWISVPNLIISCVSVAVAFIPEGLPVATTASLTIAASMMKKHKILCKSLKTVETLGTVSVICSDKTGTLTENKMVVTDYSIGLQTAEADRAKAANQASSPIDQLWSLAGLCNAAEFDAVTQHLPIASRKVHGDATDQAILRFAESVGPISELKRCWSTKFNLAFNSKNKFMIRVLGSTNPEGLGVALSRGTAAIFEPSDL